MATSPTPAVSAARQAVSLATIPEWASPDAIMRSMPASDRVGISCPALSSTPAVAPAMISRSAAIRGGEVRGDRVGVDVQQFALTRDADAGDDRYHANRQQVREQRRVIAVRLADEPEIDSFAGHARERRRFTRQPDAAVRAGQPDRASAGSADRRDQMGVGAPGEHCDDSIERGGIGDAEAIDEGWGVAAGAQLGIDRPPAPMDHDQRGRRRQPDDRRRGGSQRRLIIEQLSAEL